MALRDLVSGHGGGGLGLELVILEVFSNRNDSMILWIPFAQAKSYLVFPSFAVLCWIGKHVGMGAFLQGNVWSGTPGRGSGINQIT